VCIFLGHAPPDLEHGPHEGPWNDILRDKKLDVALLQEAVPPPAGTTIETVPPTDQQSAWKTPGGKRHFCAAIARLSDRVVLQPIPTKPLPEAGPNDLGVSLPGTLAACEVTDQKTAAAPSAAKAKTDRPQEGAKEQHQDRHTLPMFLTVPEVAELLRTTRKAVYAMIERGQIPGVARLTPKRILVRREDLLHSLDHNCAASPRRNRR
jgi:excisionase family DNA binding protein